MKNVKFSKRMENAEPSVIREMLKLSLDSEYISFAGGDPDPAFFPIKEILSYTINEKEASNILFQYSISEGNEYLREQIADYQKTLGIVSDIGNNLITTGGQQGLDLTAKLFIEKDDVIAVEGPTYMGALNAFRQYMPIFDTIGMDENGIIVDQIKEKISKGQEYKFIYTIPDFHNPTGITMSFDRRKELIKLAQENDLLIIEDSPYYKLRYEGKDIPTLKSLDHGDNVIYIGSFSKIICPGNRIGWICANKKIIEKYVIAKQAADIHSNELSQLQTAHYLENYSMEEHLTLIRKKYKEKKDAMVNAIIKYFPNEIKYTKSEGGLFIWLILPEKYREDKIMGKCLKEKVTMVPGSRFFAEPPESSHIRLSYATMGIDKIEEGIKRMAAIFK